MAMGILFTGMLAAVEKRLLSWFYDHSDR
jgi:hypothetical protein